MTTKRERRFGFKKNDKAGHKKVLTPAQRSRLPKYDWEAVEKEVLELIADGETLSQVCKRKGLPSKGKIVKYFREENDRWNRYVLARRMQADALMDESIDTARKGRDGKLIHAKCGVLHHAAGCFDANRFSTKTKLDLGVAEDTDRTIMSILKKIEEKEGE